MFGYLTANEQELKIKEYNRYRSYYCGLCRELKLRYGKLGQITLSYDMAFAAMLHAALYEPKDRVAMRRCLLHPLKRHPVRENQHFAYAADMNIVLTYYKCIDDWQDERKFSRLCYAALLRLPMRKIHTLYPEKTERIKHLLSEITSCENGNETNPDIPSGLFGEIMAEVLAAQHDEWEKELRDIGFYLGKFIYLLDAYDDLEDDKKNDRYNVLSFREDRPDFDEDVLHMLTMMAAEAAKAFERLPILRDASILRNILYSGIWNRYKKKEA